MINGWFFVFFFWSNDIVSSIITFSQLESYKEIFSLTLFFNQYGSSEKKLHAEVKRRDANQVRLLFIFLKTCAKLLIQKLQTSTEALAVNI